MLAEEHWVTEDGRPVARGFYEVWVFGKLNAERCFAGRGNPIN